MILTDKQTKALEIKLLVMKQAREKLEGAMRGSTYAKECKQELLDATTAVNELLESFLITKEKYDETMVQIYAIMDEGSDNVTREELTVLYDLCAVAKAYEQQCKK